MLLENYQISEEAQYKLLSASKNRGSVCRINAWIRLIRMRQSKNGATYPLINKYHP